MLFLMVTAVVGTALSLASRVAGAQSTSIAGRVVDAAIAMGLPGVAATAVLQTGGEARTVMSGPDGAYRFEGLPDGIYRIDFELRGFDVMRRNLVPVRAGETTQVDATTLPVTTICECIDMWGRLGRSRPRLTTHIGQVMDASSRPLPHARLEMAGPVGPEFIYADREGKFHVRLSPLHTWPLTARDSGFGPVTLKATGGTRTSLLFRLPKADTRELPTVERLMPPCCHGDLFVELTP